MTLQTVRISDDARTGLANVQNTRDECILIIVRGDAFSSIEVWLPKRMAVVVINR